jgi:alpha-tubulin suppressor-like RCC1 family protein
LKNVRSIAAAQGCYGSFALIGDGTVMAWGWNIFRHFGTGSKDEYITAPESVRNLGGVSSVAAGVSHALALKKDGTVWAWGKNWYGQLGTGHRDIESRKPEDSDYPVEVSGLKNIKQISAGYFRSLARADDGAVWRWGGYGNSEFLFPIVYEADIPVKIEIHGKVISISSGGMHDVLLCDDGTVWTCGYNTHRQLGSNNVFNEVLDTPIKVQNLSEVKAVSAGGSFTLALKKDGTVWSWGCNENGELGIGEYDTETRIVLGDNKSVPAEVSILQDVVEIAAGGSHAMAVMGDGSIWAWGGNDEGQLGNFSDKKRCIPQKIM